MIDMFDTIMNLVKEWNVTGICLRLALATFVGVIIGLDREYKNKGAGIKTHALVCIGAAMAMIVNEYVFREFPNMNTDITRLGAQVISGIGFAEGTLLAVIFILFIFRVLAPLDKKLHKNSKRIDLYMEFKDSESIRPFMESLRRQKVDLLEFDFRKDKLGLHIPAAAMSLRLPHYGQKRAFKNDLRNTESVVYFEEV